MNPLILLAVGGVALLALSGKKRTSPTNGQGGAPDAGGTPDTGDLPGPGDTDTGAGVDIPPDLLAYFSAPGAPKTGTFYPVSQVDIADADGTPYADPVKAIANMALFGQRQFTAAASQTYAVCINDSDYNGWLYGEEDVAGVTTDSDGVYAAKAFERINADALFDLLGRQIWPQVGDRGTTIEDGKMQSLAAGNRYGMLWLPPANIIQPDPGAMQVECPVGKWAGGFSTANPPEAILTTLRGTAPNWRPAQRGLTL